MITVKHKRSLQKYTTNITKRKLRLVQPTGKRSSEKQSHLQNVAHKISLTGQISIIFSTKIQFNKNLNAKCEQLMSNEINDKVY